MDTLPESWLPKITEALSSFLINVDVHTVFVIIVLSSLLKYFLWPHWKWPIAYLAFIPFLLSFVITPAMSLTDEVWWGGKYFYRAALYNGTASEVAFHVFLPHLQKKWPSLFPAVANGAKNGDLPPQTTR